MSLFLVPCSWLRTKGVSDVQVECVAGHLVGVGYVDDIAAACESHAAPDTNQSLTDAVVQDGAGDAVLVVEVVGVEEPRVDEVGRLSLHGSRQFA